MIGKASQLGELARRQDRRLIGGENGAKGTLELCLRVPPQRFELLQASRISVATEAQQVLGTTPLEIGVERYLGKPYQEADLLRNVQETLRLSRA